MNVMAYGLLVVAALVAGVFGADCTKPATGDYLDNVRIIEQYKQGLQAWVTSGDGTEMKCVEMRTNNRGTIFELECCDVCYVLTEWLDGYGDQYVDNLKVLTDANSGEQVLEFEYYGFGATVPTTTFYTVDKGTEYVNPTHYFYFSAPFTIDSRSDETKYIYVFTTDPSGGDVVNRVLTLTYDDGIGGAANVRSAYIDLTDTSKYATRVFEDWNMDMSGSRLGCFSEPFIGYSIPIKEDTGKSCFNNATVQYEIDSDGRMTRMDILDYDMFVAPAEGSHNARGISWHEYDTEVRVYYPNQDPITFNYAADQVHGLEDDETRCDIYQVPAGEQCG